MFVHDAGDEVNRVQSRSSVCKPGVCQVGADGVSAKIVVF